MCSVWWNRGSCAVCGGIGDHVQCVVEPCVWWNRGPCAVCGGIGDHVQCVIVDV